MTNSYPKNEKSKPFLKLPIVFPTEKRYLFPKKVEVLEYFAISNGYSRIFREQDGIKEYGKQIILGPSDVSYMSLFINGVLQSNKAYKVRCGEIILKTVDVPPKGAPIILQMIIIK